MVDKTSDIIELSSGDEADDQDDREVAGQKGTSTKMESEENNQRASNFDRAAVTSIPSSSLSGGNKVSVRHDLIQNKTTAKFDVRSCTRNELDELLVDVSSMKEKNLTVDYDNFRVEYPHHASKYTAKSLTLFIRENAMRASTSGTKRKILDGDKEGERKVRIALQDMKKNGITLDLENFKEQYSDLCSKYDGRSIASRIKRFTNKEKEGDQKKTSATQDDHKSIPKQVLQKLLSDDEKGRKKVIKALHKLKNKEKVEPTVENFKIYYPELYSKYKQKSIGKVLSEEIKKMRVSSPKERRDKSPQKGRPQRSVRAPVRFAEELPASLSGENDLEGDDAVEADDDNLIAETGEQVVAKAEDHLAEFLMTTVMKLTNEDRNEDLVATFVSYSQKFNNEGFNTPTILKSLKSEARLDEYLVSTISMKKGHLMMFKEWLKET
ncbi:predicted protein [Chaetoceros tenuissimus]|uniref:Uncharacterized protein n=1 Tax=Chaetoceros tenuissimus TaxID=426638 RepID=A0AAD3CWY5_9STRA|nr:predicted protein [Chaetoceros tenuissimus]